LEIAFGWLFLAVVVGIIAANRGRSGFGWFLLSLVISPLIGGILVLALGAPKSDPSSDGEHRKCPACAEWVKREAVKCKHCGELLLPAGESAAATNAGFVAPAPGSVAFGLVLGRFVARNRMLLIVVSAVFLAWLVYRQVAA